MKTFYPTEPLAHWLGTVFAAIGVAPTLADRAARAIVRTNARGIDTHGVARVLIYVDKLMAGELNAGAEVRFEDRNGLLHVHADGALGQGAGLMAVDAAAARARETGAVVAILHDVGHLGALGLYVGEAADQGMLAFMVQSTPPVMALPGSRGAAIGNNPIAFASPVAGGAPLVFDMATSGVARGNVVMAARAGRSIPEGWAIDAEGNPTTDAAAALRGAMLPVAGHKGIGLAMLVECFAGSLSGAKPPPMAATGGSAPSRVGAFLMLVNPALATGPEAYGAHLAEWMETYKTASGEQGRYPGERAHALEMERRLTGIPLPPETVADLVRAGEKAGVPFDVAPVETAP